MIESNEKQCDISNHMLVAHRCPLHLSTRYYFTVDFVGVVDGVVDSVATGGIIP